MEYDYNTKEIIRNAGIRFRKYRIWAGMTQNELALRAGISLSTVRGFETGRSANISLDTFLKIISAIGLQSNLDNLLPEMPESPYIQNKLGKDKTRIKHKKND